MKPQIALKPLFAVLLLSMAVLSLVFYLENMPKSRLESALRNSIRENRGKTIAMRDLTDFTWDRMDIYTPYSTYADSKGIVIHIDEGTCLLVFSNRDNTVALLDYKRRYGDFSAFPIKGGLSPRDARFRVVSAMHGSWLTLEPL